MITRLEIDGFKSLRDFAVDLEPLTVFIGPNSAGKSNILDALALLSRLASQPVEEAFKQGRGRALDQFTRRGGQAGSTIRFAVEVFVPNVPGEEPEPTRLPNRYRYELTIARTARSGGAEHLSITDENLKVFERVTDRWLTSHMNLADRLVHATEARSILSQAAVKAKEHQLDLNLISDPERKSYQAPLSHTALASFKRAGASAESGFALALDSQVLGMLDELRRERKLADRSAVLAQLVREERRKLRPHQAEIQETSSGSSPMISPHTGSFTSIRPACATPASASVQTPSRPTPPTSPPSSPTSRVRPSARSAPISSPSSPESLRSTSSPKATPSASTSSSPAASASPLGSSPTARSGSSGS